MGNLLLTNTSLFAAAEAKEVVTWLGMMVYLALVVAVIFVLLSTAKKDFGNRVFHNPWAQRFEQLYLFIENLCIGTIGPHGRKYVPIIIGFWIVIFVSNCIALFFPYAPTADLSFNIGLALTAWCYVQWEGMKANGVFGHIKHFTGPKLGLALIPITILIFFVEIVSEVMKNVSLSLRLYGNIHGGHEAVSAMNHLGDNIYLPFGYFLIPIKLLTCVVQALIFSLLTCVYLSLVTHHEEEHGHDDHGSEALAHAT
ncbi:MAG: F0F1 ATP synthase subunit A [Armatimonadetes bacterium]|nr:F0F1 ATP synthase subunit A [Armatimonadota bacterium]